MILSAILWALSVASVLGAITAPLDGRGFVCLCVAVVLYGLAWCFYKPKEIR